MKILLLGKDGQVGWELQRALAPLGELHALGRAQADLGDPDALRSAVRACNPDAIVNAAAYTDVERAESDAAGAHAVNALAPAVLAREAAACGAWLVQYSTDYVFDGSKDGAWTERDPVHPLSVYGHSKLAGEEAVRASGARHLILRTSWLFGTRGKNFATTMLRLARERDALDVVADQVGAPTAAALVADATALALYRIALAGPDAAALCGTYHLSAAGSTSWHGYAQYLLEQARAHGAHLTTRPDAVRPIAASAYAAAAVRPANSRLDCGKLGERFGLALPDWRLHVDRLIAELTAQGKL